MAGYKSGKMLVALLLTLATAPPPVADELVLDIEQPIIEATIAEQKLRLRVDLDGRDAVELSSAAASRLAIEFERGPDAEVGRISVPTRRATASVSFAGRPVDLALETHPGDCCYDVDGTISTALLPFGAIRFVRPGAPPAPQEQRLAMASNPMSGLYHRVLTPNGRVFVMFSLQHRDTVATAASGAILAQTFGGHFTGPSFYVDRWFGVPRPVRTIAFARPATLAGFAVDRALVRINDFRGGFALPSDAAREGDIAVKGRARRSQHAWPAIVIGREYLDSCSEIRFQREPSELLLRCDFAKAPVRLGTAP